LAWCARHELRLAWRDWAGTVTAGKSGRAWAAGAAFLAFGAFMHGLALTTVGRFADIAEPDKATLVVVTGVALMSWSLMLSQAMEAVTRVLYARSDLDLILSSPASTRKLFCVRIGVVALSVALMATLLGAPFLNVLAFKGGARWLGGYAVFAAMGATAAALALAITFALFRAIGPKRTRLVAQIAAAVIGAAFVIGVQTAAILSYGTLSRLAVLRSQTVVAPCARSHEPRLVAGAGHSGRSVRARRRGRDRACGARGCHRVVRRPFRRRHRGGGRVIGRCAAPAPVMAPLPAAPTAARLVPQGVDAAAA
jgi:ABC-2 type transport system permease protein